MFLIVITFFEKYLVYTVKSADGTTEYYHSFDEKTLVIGAVLTSWVAWSVIKRVIQARKLVRKVPKKKWQKKSLKKTLKAKNELSRKFLAKGVSENINGVGIGEHNGGMCIQVFVNDANKNLLNNSSNGDFPSEYDGIPVVLIKLADASFLSFGADEEPEEEMIIREDGKPVVSLPLPPPIRDFQETIIGGVSGANANLTGQSGTIGYFCKKKSIIPRRTETLLLSNTHVFADLKKPEIDEHDLIVQPSPGEAAKGQPIGELTNYSKIKLDNDVMDANSIDAAIAKLWKTQKCENLIPMIGKIKGFVKKEDVEPGEFARKFGRTTGFTAGNVLSICFDVWIKYDRTGQKAFFSNQILIEPNSDFEKFVDKGDSGSLVVDEDNYATGLIFAGASGKLKTDISENGLKIEISIDNYGVANPISDVLKELKIEFIAE